MNHAIDIERFDQFRDYLVQTHRVDPDEQLSFQILPGGVSSRTVRVDRPGATSWVCKQSLPKLRVQMDWFSDPMRIHREALALRWLAELLPAGHVPAFIFEDVAHHILAMSAVPCPHENWKSMLLEGRLEMHHIDQFAWLLGMLHGRAHTRREELEPLFRDRTFFESLRVEPYYECSAAMVPAARDFLTDLIQQTRQRLSTLVHGDYSPKNVLVAGETLVLLDHEVMHFGDPAFDVGFALTHLLSKAHHLRDDRLRFADAARQFWNKYWNTLPGQLRSCELERMSVSHTLGCLLARTSGRSPLEYLSTSERDRQRDSVVALLEQPPVSIAQLISRFLHELQRTT